MQKKLKILTINWTDSEGSIRKIISDLEGQTQDSCEYYHCYQVGKKGNDHNYLVAAWGITKFYYGLARICGLKYGVGTVPTLGLLCWIHKVNPDVVHVHCPNFYTINLYMLFNYLKQKKYPCIITNHAEFFYTGNCAHAFDCNAYLTGCKKCTKIFDYKHRFLLNRTHHEWKKMQDAFSDAKRFRMTAVSQWQKERIMMSPVIGEIPVQLIENAVNTKVFKPKPVFRKDFNEINKCKKPIILNVTSNFSNNIDDIKGGYYILQLSKRMPEYLFVVAGNINLIKPVTLGDNLVLLGNVTDQSMLADYYNLADLVVLTSRKETFGMACAESLCCGTPVVGFKSGGTESIAIKEYSAFVDFGDVKELMQMIKIWIHKKETFDKIAADASKRYSVERMSEQYLQIYKEAII